MSRDALVVGISAYQWLPSLNTPALDAEEIAQQLQTNGDFRVTRMPDTVQAGQSRIGVKTAVTLAELEASLVRLFKPKGANIPQTALFYFSGHGLQKDAGIQEGIWLPVMQILPLVSMDCHCSGYADCYKKARSNSELFCWIVVIAVNC